MSEQTNTRVDVDGNVFVTEESVERLVGQYPDVTPEEAIAFFVRKFNDTNASLVLLEQRAANGASASEISDGLSKVSEQIASRAGIGNFAALEARAQKLSASLSELSEAEKAKQQEQLAEAKAHREAIVLEIEALAAQDPTKIQWKQTTAKVDELFARWQSAQKSGPRLNKTESNELWKRFRDARHKLDQLRRGFFAELDAKNKGAKSAKEQLISQAEKIAESGSGDIGAYRKLLEEWKKAPRAGKKIDDALWARFKAAGDAIYSAKKAEDEAEDASFAGNLEAKLAILAEAEALLTATDHASARAQLNNLQKKWDAAGKVPRAQFKTTEDRMRKVEQAVKALEDKHWSTTDPEKQARSEGLAGQITQKILLLEAALAEATSTKNSAKAKELEEAIATQREWLNVVS